MEITRTARAEHFEIKLKGRMDGTWSDHVARALAESVQSGQHVIALDMAEVDYMSSAGIRILVLYSRQLKSIHGRFFVINASHMVRKVLELSGLDSLLQVPTGASAPVAVGAGQIALPLPGASAEIFELAAEATLRAHWPGNPAPWLAAQPQSEVSTTVEFTANTMGIGLGALGDGEADSARRLGEFLAAGGAAVCQPADGSNKPDYLLLQGALTPAMKVAYGMLGCGNFRRLLRFDKGLQQSSLPFSTVVNACLDASGGEAVGLVMVAETASLIGASLKKMPPSPTPANAPASLFAFPGVRDWLSFTAEAAFANSTSLVVGFAARQARGPGFRLLKPILPGGELLGHFHAAAFPYLPLRKGKVDLDETIRPLFESGQILGLLHLLNDWREINGAGESRFLRGACWCSPLVT